jgi:hypothetical protein
LTIARRFGIPAGILSALLGLVYLFQPIPFGMALRAWLVGLGGLAAAELVRAAVSPYPRLLVEPVRLGGRRKPPPQRPAGLEEVERAVDFAVWNAVDFRRRLRPMLHDIASHRLHARSGIDLDANPGAARQALGEEAWALLGAAEPEPSGRRGPGVTPAELREAIQRLEAL